MPRIEKPCTIKHVNFKKNDNFATLANLAAKACHMDRGEMALLMYYAGQSSGFQPAIKTISEAIGVHPTTVHANRKRLMSKGIVIVVGKELMVDWNRIRILASLDPAMTTSAYWSKPRTPVTIDRVGNVLRHVPRILGQPDFSLAKLILKLGDMSELMYTTWRADFRHDVKAYGISYAIHKHGCSTEPLVL